MKNILLGLALISSVTMGFSNNPIVIYETLEWEKQPTIRKVTANTTVRILAFTNANLSPKHPTLPKYSKSFPVGQYGELEVTLNNTVFEPIALPSLQDIQHIPETIEIESWVSIARRKKRGEVTFIPIRKNPTTGSYEKLVSFQMTINVIPKSIPSAPVFSNKSGTSILNDGDIYKIAVSKTGIYQLSYDFLKNELGISNLDNINPRTIKLYGNGGGLLPQANSSPRYDDLMENAIQIIGEEDGQFNSGDYILFYGQAAHTWHLTTSIWGFDRQTHTYDNKNHYFIKISSGNGKRITSQNSIENTVTSTSTYNDYQHYEQDIFNLLHEDDYAHGSGKTWYGENFKFTLSRPFDFIFPNIVNGDSVKVAVHGAGRAFSASTNFSILANGTNIGMMSFPTVINDVETRVANGLRSVFNFPASSSNMTIQIDYDQRNQPNAEAWLNYITLNARQHLTFTGEQLDFRDLNTLGQASTTFNLSNANGNIKIWDVTNPIDVKNQNYTINNSQINFGVETTELKEFIAFGGNFLTAEKVGDGAIANQNLHGLTPPNLLIVYHSKFEDAVQRLADHRRNFSNVTVATVEVGQIYNEFASGNTDVTAIRDFVKYLYDQGTDLKYLLLFGDASFDFKNIYDDPENHHYVPTYETNESLHPIFAFPMDDYFGLLDATEGRNPDISSSGSVDIGIGRFPVRSELEANQVVNKIIEYDTNTNFFGDWKNTLTFVADDEDGNWHLRDANNIADRTLDFNPTYNLNKIFIDAYPQEILPAGERYPQAKTAITASVFKGSFILSYLGHGDSKGWAQERILNIPEVNSWTNNNRLPLFITATCSFGPYDDKSETSIGELLFLKRDGGAVALFTTVRAVYASSNKALTQSVYDNAFQLINNKHLTLGEILSNAKNGCCTANSRKFTLLGDPSMVLAYPDYEIVTTKINGNPITTDTIRALQEVTIEGEIHGTNGTPLTNFNGTIYPTVFDKKNTIQALGNDPASRPSYEFDQQRNILFRGRASVQNGQFSFSFIVPRDIDYEFGFGKLSYYAEDGMNQEAAGFNNAITIGGAYANPVVDDEGPKVQVFMNNEDFTFGGITDENPKLYVKLSDDSGINTSSTGIGHDITAVLDNTPETSGQTYLLNDFYESALDNFREGIAQYPLSQLETGRHHVTVKAWDVANNSGTGYTEFVVATSANMALDHVLNYPNPFTTNTEFQFEHNMPGQVLTVQVQIFSVSGKLVKTIQEEVVADGYRVTGIKWDGTDDFGNNIGRGVYVYKVSVGIGNDTNNITTSESQFEKLVILK